MAINIKNPETYRLARELAAATGETLTQAIIIAILFDEPESERMIAAISRDPRRLIGAATLVEAAAVALRTLWQEHWCAGGAELGRLSILWSSHGAGRAAALHGR